MSVSAMPAKSPTAEALKKLSRYCCQECGAKELFLYCWKGCRHVQGIKSFYADTRELRKELETLQATVYAQELRFHDYELQLKEKQQCLEFLAQQVASLNDSVGCAGSKMEEDLQAKSSLPNWAATGVKMLWNAFADGDSELSDQAVNSLKQHLRANHRDVETLLPLDDSTVDGTDVRGNALALLPLYTLRDGMALLKDDLRSLGILLGSSDICADLVGVSDGLLDQIAVEFAHLKRERDDLQGQVDDSVKAKARLREAYAASTASADIQARELQQLKERNDKAANETRVASEKAVEFKTLLKRAEVDLAAAKHAALDLRALVDDQVTEKERWQRYCWELEERLHDAIETTRVKERDLWRARDSKKEEVRKSMLLYMDAEKGKRHVQQSASGRTSVGSIDRTEVLASSKPEANADQQQ